MIKYDIIIIGSGVAGLTAGMYSARAKKSVLIIEENFLGGTTATLENIENYPGFMKINGFDLIQNMVNQCISLGVQIEFCSIKNINYDKNIVNCDKNMFEYKSLIIASGTSPVKLNLKNEDYFKFKGLSYCAVCDASLYKNKRVIVVTKNLSAEHAIDYLSNLTNDLTILDLSNNYQNENLKVFHDVKIVDLIGEDRLNAVKFISQGNEITLECDGLFVELGKQTNLKLFKDNLETSYNFLVTDENMHTIIPNVFVAGDIRKKNLRQIVTACSDGAIASTEAIKYLNSIH